MNRNLRVAFVTLFVLAPGLAAPAVGQECWDVIFVRGQRVGKLHVQVENLEDKGRELRRVIVDWDLKFKRDKDVARITQKWGTIETPAGQILRLDVRTQAAESVLRTHGDVKDGVMRLEVDGGGNSQVLDIPWGDDVRGPYGAEISLSREKLKPGETRKVKTFIPDFNRICETTLVAVSPEEIPLGPKNEKRKLLRVEQTVTELDGKLHPEMAATLWIDDSGQILKAHSEMLGGTDYYRTTKAGADADDGVARFDLLAASIIKCRAMPQSEAMRSVVYRVTTKNDEAATLFPNDPRQSTTPGSTRKTATLVVKSAGVGVGAREPRPGAEYMRPNPLINSDDSTVVSVMQKAVGTKVDPWDKAVAIEQWVARNVTEKNFNVAFAPAKEVARNRAGDCSEHSVLVAAMCRAAGIPSRCVVGVVYGEKQGGFGPHMWNEVYIDGYWRPLDAAFDQSTVDATHLKLSTSSLDSVAPFEAFTPVLKVFDQLKIDPIEIR